MSRAGTDLTFGPFAPWGERPERQVRPRFLPSPLLALAVVAEGRVALADHLAEALLTERLHPAVRLLGVARDAVEQGPEQLGGAKPHVLEGLIDEQLVEGELVGGDVLEALGILEHPGRQLVGRMDAGDQPDPQRGLGVDRLAGEQELLRVLEAEPVDPEHGRGRAEDA